MYILNGKLRVRACLRIQCVYGSLAACSCNFKALQVGLVEAAGVFTHSHIALGAHRFQVHHVSGIADRTAFWRLFIPDHVFKALRTHG